MRMSVAPSMIADCVIRLRIDGIRRRHRQDGIIRERASGINQRKFLCLDVIELINGTYEIAALCAIKGIRVCHIASTFHVL